MRTAQALLIITGLLLCITLPISAQAANRTQGGRGQQQQRPPGPSNTNDTNHTQAHHANGNHSDFNASQAQGRPEGNATRNGTHDHMGERPGMNRGPNRGNASDAANASTDDAAGARLLASNDTAAAGKQKGEKPDLVNGRFRPGPGPQNRGPAAQVNGTEANSSRPARGRDDGNVTRNGTDDDHEFGRGPARHDDGNRTNASRADGDAARNETHEHRGPHGFMPRRDRNDTNATEAAAPADNADAAATAETEVAADANADATEDAAASTEETAEAEEEGAAEDERRMLRGAN